MIKLSLPRAYDAIKPLHGSDCRPVRCADPCLVSPSVRSCPGCTPCTAQACARPVRIATGHRWYYDLTAGHSLSEDPESLLVWLCDDCAARLAGKLQFAGTDALCDIPCWQCHNPVQHTERNTP